MLGPMTSRSFAGALGRQAARKKSDAYDAREVDAGQALVTMARSGEVQRLHEQAIADLRWAIAHPKIETGSQTMLRELLAWMEERPSSLLPPRRVNTVMRILHALRMVDAGVEVKPRDPNAPVKNHLRATGRRRYTPAPIADFLKDASLLPKKPPGKTAR